MSTGYANLRNHLEKTHKEQYRQLCEENGWDCATGPKVAGPTIGDNRKQALPLFSPEAFLEYLVRFVTADDQVRVRSVTV